MQRVGTRGWYVSYVSAGVGRAAGRAEVDMRILQILCAVVFKQGRYTQLNRRRRD